MCKPRPSDRLLRYVGVFRLCAAGTTLANALAMINTNQIKPNTPVFCSKNVQLGVVDHMEGADSIKLNKDKGGQHHYIPLSWVLSVDGKVHLDRPGEQCMREWTTSPTKADGASRDGASKTDGASRKDDASRAKNKSDTDNA